jgi:transcriptional regulatory protein RtcR
MATLAQAGRITETIVDDEVTRLLRLWRPYAEQDRRETIALDGIIGAEAASRLDLFDAMQLSAVIKVCRQSKSLSDAGRSLFGVSRAAKSKPNDADRLKKYLARFDLSWDQIAAVPD